MSARPRPEEAVAPDRAAARAEARERVIAALETGAATDPAGRLAELGERFGLDPLELDLLALLWTGAFDPGVRAAATDGGPVTALLVAALFGHDVQPRLSSGSSLLLWRMVREHALPDGGAALTIDPAILTWLDGAHELDRALVGRAHLLEAGPELADWPIDVTAAEIRAGLHDGRRWRIRIVADDGVAAEWFAAAIGRRIGLPVLAVDRDTLADTVDAAVLLHRQAFLDGCLPFVAAADAELSRPLGATPYPLQFVHGEAEIAPAPGLVDLAVALAPPGAETRERLWRRLLPAAASWRKGSLADLALCHEADAGDIAAVAALGPADADAAAALLRERSRGDAGPMARRIDAVFRWSDLVLPEPIETRLTEFAFEARERARLWQEPAAARLFPYGRGLIGLFAGPPGTGKTMAAQVLAADLGLDLLAVDLSAVVSKWVGETAQNIQALLSSRTARRSILFFDEADALYAKRVEELRDAQDRFANYDSSQLMTALESYPGIVILATNLKANIDSAFLRRIRHIVDFPQPDAAARARLWRSAIDALFPREQARRLRPGIERVARIEASGALIKNAALSALFAARRAGTAPSVHLLGEMLARELGKEGGGLSARDLDSLLGEAP